jgi:hypothetical protein
MEPLTVIFFSCRRLEILKQSVNAFIKSNTYPITDFIIVNDSGDDSIHSEIMRTYRGATLVFNKENVGLIKSIDLGYKHIKTEYLFHCEDDWSFTGKGGFLEESMTIMLARPEIEEVWLKDMNGHPVEDKLYNVDSVSYRLVQDNFQKGKNGYNNFAWHGFATACGLKRLSDYKRVAPYADIPWQGNIWHREQAIGEKYHALGYRTAILTDEYIENIGYGKSEYVTGYEK